MRTLSPCPRLTFPATVFVSTEHFLPAFSPLPRAGLFVLPFRPILIRTRRVNPPPNLPVKISRTLSACIFCASCRSSRRTYFFPSVCVRFSRNKPHARRNAAFARLTSAAERRIKQKSHRQQPSFYLSASYAAPRRFSPPAASNSASKKHIKKNVPEKRFSGTIPKSKIRLTSSPRQPASQLLRSGPRSSFPSLRPSRRTRNGSLSRPPHSECRQPSFCRP